jgi:hypothetical protein
MPFKKRSPDDHPLRWGEAELAYMVDRLKRPDGTIANVATIYRLMGYDGPVSMSFKVRVEKLKKADT